jgi:inner membrane protein
MLFFGHMGITLGAAAVAAHTVTSRKANPATKESWFVPVTRYVDIRLLIIGSMLPDIIDKPIGIFFFGATFSNGRIFTHTLLFLILITATGYYLYKRSQKLWMLTLAVGDFMHLALDEMWQVPTTLFWPLMGFNFPQLELNEWIANMLQALFSSPYIYISETVGLAILIWFGVWVIRQKKVGVIIRRGKID